MSTLSGISPFWILQKIPRPRPWLDPKIWTIIEKNSDVATWDRWKICYHLSIHIIFNIIISEMSILCMIHCHLDPHDTNLMLKIESHENHRVYTHFTIDLATLPSGKHTENYRKSPFYSWVNQLFLWSFSIAVFLITRGYYPLYPQTKSRKKNYSHGHFTIDLATLTSGKRLHNYGKLLFSMGQSTISTGPFSSSQTVNVYQRLTIISPHLARAFARLCGVCWTHWAAAPGGCIVWEGKIQTKRMVNY